MSSSARKDRWQRQNHRQEVLPQEIRGLITQTDRGVHVPFLIWDISEDGIGLWVSSTLQEGEKITLTIGQPYLLVVNCRVKWCEQQKSVPGFRCGLEFAPEHKRALDALVANYLPHDRPEPHDPYGEPADPSDD